MCLLEVTVRNLINQHFSSESDTSTAEYAKEYLTLHVVKSQSGSFNGKNGNFSFKLGSTNNSKNLFLIFDDNIVFVPAVM